MKCGFPHKFWHGITKNIWNKNEHEDNIHKIINVGAKTIFNISHIIKVVDLENILFKSKVNTNIFVISTL